MFASVDPNAPSPACDWLAHRYGNVADGPVRVRCYGSDLTEAEWQVVRPLLPVPAWLEGGGGRTEGYCHRVMLDEVRDVVDNGAKRVNLPGSGEVRVVPQLVRPVPAQPPPAARPLWWLVPLTAVEELADIRQLVSGMSNPFSYGIDRP